MTTLKEIRDGRTERARRAKDEMALTGPRCVCGTRLPKVLTDAGETTHATCTPDYFDLIAASNAAQRTADAKETS